MVKATRAVQEAARRIVRERDGGRCLMCGIEATDVHHRRRKGMGGSALLERPSNLVTLCGLGNTSGHHGWVHQNPDQANQYGWVLYEFETTAETPVLTPDGWFTLDDLGSRHPYIGEASG
jgi:hypothetical protein